MTGSRVEAGKQRNKNKQKNRDEPGAPALGEKEKEKKNKKGVLKEGRGPTTTQRSQLE